MRCRDQGDSAQGAGGRRDRKTALADDHFRDAEGWTGPKEVDGKVIEGTFRAHQVPISMEKEEHLAQLEAWLRSYRPEELFGDDYRLIPELRELAPGG